MYLNCSWSSNSLPSFLCFSLSVPLNAPWPSSSSEHTVVIIHSQSVHWTTTDSFKYCPQLLLHFSVSILIHISPVLCYLDLLMLSAMNASTFLSTATHFCIHSITPSPSNNYFISVISPNRLSYLYYLLFSQSSELGGDLLPFTYLCLWPLAIMLGLRQRSHQGLCQCWKLVCH